MDLLKRNPVFFGFCAVSVLVFLGLIVLIFVEVQKLGKAEAKIASADGQIKAIIYANPAPSNQNVKVARTNLEELQEKLKDVFQELQQDADLTASEDGVIVISNILRYISDYRKRVKNHIDANTQPSPVEVPDQFAFGFEEYSRTTIIPKGGLVPVLNKQRQILSDVLDKLIDSHPTSIQAVRRENLDRDGSVAKDTKFAIDPAISARVRGSIDTLAFQVTFTGYTSALRKFLNSLADFRLPVVVRSVEVERDKSESQNGASEIFNRKSEDNDTRTPVISEIESTFTVTLEFIEVIMPPDLEEDRN